MNIGLILFLSGILLGNTGDEKSSDSAEAQKNTKEQVSSPELIENNNNSVSNKKKFGSINIDNSQELISKKENNPPSIHGKTKKEIKQGEYFSFTPYASDLDEDNLFFSITNQPEWCVFDTRTGSLIGQPANLDVGFTEEIIITVTDSHGLKASLNPFKIEVVNVNDSPHISGNPPKYVYAGKSYKFTPDVKDIDLKVAQDKLIFSINNKPSWASFNKANGQLSGTPKVGHAQFTKDIIITVTDRYGLSDRLKPFDLTVFAKSKKPKSDITISQIAENLFTPYKIIKKGFLVDSKNSKSNVITGASSENTQSINNTDDAEHQNVSTIEDKKSSEHNNLSEDLLSIDDQNENNDAAIEYKENQSEGLDDSEQELISTINKNQDTNNPTDTIDKAPDDNQTDDTADSQDANNNYTEGQENLPSNPVSPNEDDKKVSQEVAPSNDNSDPISDNDNSSNQVALEENLDTNNSSDILDTAPDRNQTEDSEDKLDSSNSENDEQETLPSNSVSPHEDDKTVGEAVTKPSDSSDPISDNDDSSDQTTAEDNQRENQDTNNPTDTVDKAPDDTQTDDTADSQDTNNSHTEEQDTLPRNPVTPNEDDKKVSEEVAPSNDNSDPISNNDSSSDQTTTEDNQQENQETENLNDTVDKVPDDNQTEDPVDNQDSNNSETDDTGDNQDSDNNQTSDPISNNDSSSDQTTTEDNQQENQETENLNDTVDKVPDDNQTEDPVDNQDSNNSETDDTGDNQDSNNNQTSDPTTDNDSSSDQTTTEDNQQENQETENLNDTVDKIPDDNQTEDPVDQDSNNSETDDTGDNEDSNNNQTSDPTTDNDSSSDQTTTEDNQQENQETENPTDTVDKVPDDNQTEDPVDNQDSNNSDTDDTGDNQDSNNNQTSDPIADNDSSSDQTTTEDNQRENQDTNNPTDTVNKVPDDNQDSNNSETGDTGDNQDSDNNQTSDPIADNDSSSDQTTTEDNQQENQDTNNLTDTVDKVPDDNQTEDPVDNQDSNNSETDDTGDNQDSNNNQTSDPIADNDSSSDQTTAEDNQRENQDTNNPTDTVDKAPDDTQTDDTADSQDTNNSHTEEQDTLPRNPVTPNEDDKKVSEEVAPSNDNSDPISNNDSSSDQTTTEDNQQENQETENLNDTVDKVPDDNQTEDPVDNQDSNNSETDDTGDNQDSDNNQTSDPISNNDSSSDQTTTEDNQQENQETENLNDTVDKVPDDNQTEDPVDNQDSNNSETDDTGDNQDSNNNQTSDPTTDNDSSSDQTTTEDNQQENQDTNNPTDTVDKVPDDNQTEDPVENQDSNNSETDDTGDNEDSNNNQTSDPTTDNDSSSDQTTTEDNQQENQDTNNPTDTVNKVPDNNQTEEQENSEVIGVNDSPILSVCQNLFAHELRIFECTIEATDVDQNNKFTYRLIKAPEGMVIDPNLGKIIWTPDNKSTSNFNEEITVEVDDGSGAKNATVSQSFTIRVTAIDDKPDIVQEPSLQQTAHEDSVYKLILKVKDPDSDSLTVKFNNKPEWLTLSLSSPEKEGDQFTINLEGTPLNKHVGDNHLHMVITDSKSDIPYGTVIIKVSNTNDSPVAKNKQVTVLEQTPLPIKLEATDPDKNEFLKYRIHEKPTHISTEIFQLNKSTVIYTSNSDTATSDKFSFEVCDLSNACDTATVNIAITPIDDRPIITSHKTATTLTVSEDSEYNYKLRIEDPDSDRLILNLDKFPNWLKVKGHEYKGQGDKVTLFENTEGDFEAILQGTPTDLYTDDHDNTVKLAILDNTFKIPFELPITVFNINDAPEPWVWGSDSKQDLTEKGGVEWNWQLPSNIVAKDGKEFIFNLYDHITFVDADGDKIICEASLYNGAPLPEWLIFEERETNFSGKNYFFSGTPSDDDVSKSNLDIRLNAYDGNGGMASVYFKLPLENIEYDPVLTGDFTAPIYLRSSYTLTADDLFYHDSDSADSTDKIRFHVSNMQNGYFQNFPHGPLSFTGEQLINGELTWILDNNETLQATSFDVLITDNSGRSSSTKVFNLTVKESSKSNLPPELVVDLKAKTFSWQSGNNTSDAIYEYIFCEWNYDYMRAINCQDWVESENTSYKISEDISGSYSLHVREIQRITDEGTVFEMRSPIARKSIAIPIISVFDKTEKEIKRGSVTSDREVTVKIDLLFKPTDSWGDSIQSIINEFYSHADHFQFYPDYDITVDNATWTSESYGTISSQNFTLKVEANHTDEVTVTIAANQYSRAEDTSEQNAIASFSWKYGALPPYLFNMSSTSVDPNTFKWAWEPGKDEDQGLYSNFVKTKYQYYVGGTTPPEFNSSYWNNWNDSNNNIFIIHNSAGIKTLHVKEWDKSVTNYSDPVSSTIFIPIIKIIDANNSVVSNNAADSSSIPNKTADRVLTLKVDTMVKTESFSEDDIVLNNVRLTKWNKLDEQNYEAEAIIIDLSKPAELSINREAYTDKDHKEDKNEAASVSWQYTSDYNRIPIITTSDVKENEASQKESIAFTIYIKQLREQWPGWTQSDIEVENVYSPQDFSCDYADSCDFTVYIKKDNCSDGCQAKLIINNTGGDLMDSFIWNYTPTPKGNEQQEQEPSDNQLGPAPELILRDEGANNQRERVLEIKGIEFTIGRNTPHFHPDMQIDGGRLIHFNQIQPRAWAATIEANEPGAVTAIIFENIGGQNNKSASKNWAYQPDDNNQNNKIVTPKITVKDATGKIIGDTTNGSMVIVEIDTIVDTTDFKQHDLQIEGARVLTFKSQGNSKRLYKVNLLATSQPQISLRIKADTYRENQDSQNSTSACQESKANCKRNAEASIQWTYDPEYNSGKEINIGWVWSAKESTDTKIYTGRYRYRRVYDDNNKSDWTETTNNFYYPTESPSEGEHKLEVQAQFNSITTLTLPDESKRTYVVTKWDTSNFIPIQVNNLKIYASSESNSILKAEHNLNHEEYLGIEHHYFEKLSYFGHQEIKNKKLTYKSNYRLKNLIEHPNYNASADYQDIFILKSYKANAWNNKYNHPAGDPAITSFFTVSIIDSTFSIENKLFSLEVVDRKGRLTDNLLGLVKDSNGNSYSESFTFKESNNEFLKGFLTISSEGKFTYSLKDYDFPNDEYEVADIFSFIAHNTVTGQKETGLVFLKIKRNSPINIVINDEYSKQAVVGTKITKEHSVKVTDSNGEGIEGVTVNFKVGEGYGYVKEYLPVTDNYGIATIGSWTLGIKVGINKLTASVTQGVNNTSIEPVEVEFEVEGIADQAIKFDVVEEPVTGAPPINQSNIDSEKTNSKYPKNNSGKPIPVQPRIKIYDQYGNLANSNASVTVKVNDGILSCNVDCHIHNNTATINAVQGIATFIDLALEGKVGQDILWKGEKWKTIVKTGYFMTFHSPGLESDNRIYRLELTPGNPYQLVIIEPTSPIEVTNGAILTPLKVKFRDSAGNLIDSTNQDGGGNTVTDSNEIINISIDGDENFSLACHGEATKCLTAKVIDGIATFKNIKIEGMVGQTYTLTFESGAIKSTVLDITIDEAGVAAKLVLGDESKEKLSETLQNGQTLPTLNVEIKDSSGNTVTDHTPTVEIAIDGNAKLSCEDPCVIKDSKATVRPVNGKASFDNVRIVGKEGNTYNLTITTESGEQQLTASVNNKKVTYTVEISYPVSKLTITKTPLNANKFKINISDLIATKRKEYLKNGISILNISDAMYSDEVAEATYKRPYDDLIINVKDDKNTHNEKLLKTALLTISTNLTKLSHLDEQVIQEITLMPQKCKKGPVDAIKEGTGEDRYWVDAYNPGKSLEAVLVFDIPIINEEKKYNYKLEGSGYAGFKRRPIYYDCGASSNEETDEQTKKAITIPSMAIQNEAQIGEIHVEIQDYDGNRLSSAKNVVTVALNRQTYPPLQCIDAEMQDKDENDKNHCEDARLSCSNNIDDCKKVRAENGIATFDGLVLNGQVGKIYSLQFTTGELDTANNHKSQVYIYKAGEISVSESEIKVVEAEASITADGKSSATITVQLNDASGNPIMGKQVTLNTNIGTFENNEDSIVVTDKGNGLYEAPITSLTLGDATITAELDDSEITAEKVIEFKAGEAANISTITRGNKQIDNFGDSVKSSFSVTIKDNFKHPVNEQVVTFTVEGGGYIDNNGTTFVTVPTNTQGIATLNSQRWILGDQPNSQTLTASIKINDIEKSSTITANTKSLVIHKTPVNVTSENIYFGDFIYQKITAARADDFETFGFIYFPKDEQKSELKTFDLKEKEDMGYIRSYLEQKHKNQQILFLNDASDKDQEFELYSKKCEQNHVIAEYFDVTEHLAGPGGKNSDSYWWSRSLGVLSAVETYILPPYKESDFQRHWEKRPVYYNCKSTPEILTFPKTYIANASVLNGYQIAFYDTENNVLTDTNGTIKVEINSPASLDCDGGGDDCLTEETTNGVATFNGLVIKGELGKIYSLQFTTDEFNTDNNHKSQIYIYKAGEFSKDKSKIDVEEGKESITADGTSTTKVKVQLKDASGNPITGKQVTLNTNIGSFENNKQRIVVTDKGNGIYEALVTSTNARTAIIIATVGDQQIEGNASVNFIAGKPHKIEIIRNGNTSYAKTAIVGNKITGIPLSFKVTDAQDNPIETTVTLKVINGNGSLSFLPNEVTTNDKGIATFDQISWYAGTQTGQNQLNVSVDGIQQSVEFKVEGVSDGPFSISEYTDDSYAYSKEGPAGNKLTNPPKVLVKDQYDNLVNGHNISYTINSEDNRLVEDTAEIINGIATLNQLLNSPETRKAVNYEIVAKIDSEKVVTFNVKGTADYDNLRFREVPEEQTTTVGTKVERPPSVTVTDDFGNLAKDKPVIFEIVDSLNLHQNDCGLEYLQNDTFYGSLKANLGSTDSQSFVYKTIQDKDEKANVSPAHTYFNDPQNDANGQWRKDNNDGSIEKIYCTNYLNKPKHVATEIITDQYGKATLPNWFLGHKAGAEYELKAYINKGTNNQSSISFFATATATLNHTKRISVTEVIENGGIEIIQDLDANYQAKLSHIEIDQIHDKYGNKIYAKDSEDIETPTGEFKIHISIKDDESNYQLECKPSQASNACEGDNNKVTLTFIKEDVENKKLKFEDVLFTGKYNKEYKILFEIEGIERELQEFNLDPTLTINRTKPRLALRTYYPTGEEPSNYENLDKKRETKTIEVRNGTMEHTPNDFYINDHPVVGDIDERSLKIDIKDPNGSAANITEIKSIIIEIEGEEGTLSCDDKTLCKKEGEDESVAVYPSGEIFTLETMGIQGKVGQTYTLKFTSEGLISTTLTVTINKAGEPAKLSIKQQPSDTAENGVPLKVQPIIQFLDANNNIVAKPDIAVQVNYQTTIDGQYDCDFTGDVNNPTIDCKNDNSISINNHRVETAESGQAIFDLTLNGKVGFYTLTFTAENLEKIESQPIKLIAGPAAKLKFIQPSSTITNGETLEKQPIIKLVDSAGNDVKSDGVTITAKVNNQTLIDEQYCTNYNFGCTNPILYGTKVVQTDKSGQAKFTDLSISGQLNTKYELIFTATGLISEKSENITIDKPGKPKQIKIYQNQIENGFASESVLNHVQVQIQDSGGNEVEISLSAGAQLDIELTEGTNAELGCVGSENHGCIPYENGKKITIQIYQPTNTLDTVILAGKIDSHKLEFKAEFSNTDYVIGEQSFNIDHAGKVTDIFIIHPLNKEEIKEYHDIVEVTQMSHCNPLKGGNYTFKDKYKNTIKNTLTGKTRWQREHKEQMLYVETLSFDVNKKGESESVYKSDDFKIWSEPENKNQPNPGETGIYQASVDGKNITICTYNFYMEIAEEIGKLKWPLETNFSEKNFFEQEKDLYLKDHISPLRGKFEPELSSNSGSFIYKPDENSIITLDPQALTKFDSFTLSVYKDEIKYFDLPYSISILHDPHYNKQWHMHESNGLNINSITKKSYTGEGVTVAIIGDGIDITHSDLDLTNNINDKVISSDGNEYYQTDYVDFKSSDENSNHTYVSHSVAGIIGATGWNNQGIRGIAPKVKLKGFRLAKDIKLIPHLKYGIIDESWALGEPINCSNSNLYKLSSESCKEIESELTNFRMGIRPNHNIIYNLTYDTSRTAQNRLDATLEELFWSTEKPVFFYQQQPTSIIVNADNQQNIKSNGGIFIRGAGDGFKKFGGVICGERVCESSTELCLEPFDYPLSCQITSMDPRANHPAMINVAALDKQEKIASYSAHGSSNWISAPGGEEGEGIQTTCYNNNNNCINGYTNSFYGTSAASAMASGTVALMLNANYKLTWRDVKYILAKTAKAINSDPFPSSDNKAGYVYSNAYGFGVINATEAVDMAKSYQQDLGELLHAKESSEIKTINQNHDAYIEAIKIKVALKPYEASLGDNIATEVSDFVDIVFSNIVPSVIPTGGYPNIGFPYSIELISPAGTRSVLLSPHSAIEALELNDAKFAEIELSTNAFFGEKMEGEWKLIINDHYIDEIHRSKHKMHDFESWELNLYGTQTDISKNPTPDPNQTIN